MLSVLHYPYINVNSILKSIFALMVYLIKWTHPLTASNFMVDSLSVVHSLRRPLSATSFVYRAAVNRVPGLSRLLSSMSYVPHVLFPSSTFLPFAISNILQVPVYRFVYLLVVRFTHSTYGKVYTVCL